MTEERLEIIEKLAHKSGDARQIELCCEIRRLQNRVATLAADERQAWTIAQELYYPFSADSDRNSLSHERLGELYPRLKGVAG